MKNELTLARELDYLRGFVPRAMNPFRAGLLFGLAIGFLAALLFVLVVTPYRYDRARMSGLDIPTREHRLTGKTQHYLLGWQDEQQPILTDR